MRWNPVAVFFLGAWLILSISSVGNHNTGTWWNDLAAGILICVLAAWNIFKPRPWQEWLICVIGAWLLYAPLIFWSASPAVYGSDTLIGILLIVFSVVIRTYPAGGSGIPEGWSYNPSTWGNRGPIVFLGLLAFFLARMMAAYQLEHTPTVFEPFFGNGTKQVLTSSVAEAFPISDAGLGAATYLLEALSGLVGDTRRWKTMPWMVLLFFVLVVPAGVVSIVLIMLQPVVVGAWCTLCLLTALLTLLTLPPAVDEIFASFQFMALERRKGNNEEDNCPA